MKIKIYTLSDCKKCQKYYQNQNCHDCEIEKAFFDKRKILYKEVDVSKRIKDYDLISLLGEFPITFIDDKITLGLNKKRLNNLIELSYENPIMN
jgi:arsenate reductase-like glutaredoxin family protein